MKRKVKNMSKYEVWITRWSDEVGHQIKEVAGEFNSCMNANLFAQAYADYYRSTVEIVEYVKKGVSEVTPNL